MPAPIRPTLSLVSILSNSDSITALIWASAAGWLATLALVLGQQVRNGSQPMHALLLPS
jgi:hypothetical protein